METLLLQLEEHSCHPQNQWGAWSLAYQGWYQIWVSRSFQGVDVAACHSSQGFVATACPNANCGNSGEEGIFTPGASLSHLHAPLCARRGSFQQSAISPKVLADDRYCWCHDQVLKAVAEGIITAVHCSRHCPSKNNITLQKGWRFHSHLLTPASNWQLKVDLGKQLKVPEHIAQTRLFLDLLFYSDTK